jgi:(p)ppGpp synthase/HD superfamily hydrolase
VSELLERAFTLAYELHATQTRKASIVPGAPYLSHLMEVSGMVLANGGDETVGAAALLHDAIEDQGYASQARILETCGAEVLALVLECTEDGTGDDVKASWWARKGSYLHHIAVASPGALMISVADKLQSARELKRQVRLSGDAPYDAFVKKECSTVAERKRAVLWFHKKLVESYRDRLEMLATFPDAPTLLVGISALIEDFDEVVQYLVQL